MGKHTVTNAFQSVNYIDTEVGFLFPSCSGPPLSLASASLATLAEATDKKSPKLTILLSGAMAGYTRIPDVNAPGPGGIYTARKKSC
jgi:hypothetical protein